MPVKAEQTKSDVNLARARVALTIMFFVCLALTIASIVTDVGPSFTKCAAATVILHFVKESAVQMIESKKS